jgi:probable phosphoglycerate mutase
VIGMDETIIYLIRHSDRLKKYGIFNAQEDDQIRNEKDILSIDGEKKAKKLSKKSYLKNIDCLWSSNHVRSLATAKYIASENNIDINIDSRFGERKLGDLVTLKQMAIGKVNDYATDQLLNPNLKNKDGETNYEVMERMFDGVSYLLDINSNKKIVIVSHGAAIKFLLMKWCTYDHESASILYKGKFICNRKIEPTDCIRLTFKDKELVSIKKM